LNLATEKIPPGFTIKFNIYGPLMTPERWQQIDEILQAALDLAPGHRSAFLDKACSGDAGLRRDVEDLISSHDDAGSFIEAPAVESTARAMADDEAESAARSLIGKSLGRYHLLKLLGVGGMGQVYLARDEKLGRKVALKLLPTYFTTDTNRLRRFQQEAATTSALNHPNIVTIYEVAEVDGMQFIATELIDGETLRHRLTQGRLSVSEALEITTQVAAAIEAAHEAKIVHRDIKPDNIMIRRRDRIVKVLDFGLAKLTDDRALSQSSILETPTRALVKTDAGMVMGTAHYMSPEQARGLPIDARTDIWSLGVVLYEVVAGVRPFKGETNSDVLVSILEREPLPLSHYQAEAPAELQWIVTKALRKDKEERYQTIRELLTDLRTLMRQLQFDAHAESSRSPHEIDATARSGARAPQTTEALGESTSTLSAPTVSSAEYIVREIKRHKRGVIIFGALLLVGLIGVGVVMNLPGVGYGLYKLIAGRSGSPAPFSKIKVAKLTTSGKASQAALSPDGKYVVHVTGGMGQQSLSLRHIATGSDKEIVPSNGSDFSWVTFSPDGSYVLYCRKESGVYPLYRVPVLGGTPKQLIAEDVDTPPTFSPDGKRFVFVRGQPQKGEVSLMLANADGSEEHTFIKYKVGEFNPSVWPTPGWSPDGETIAFAHRTSDGDGKSTNIVMLRVKDGMEKQITSHRWSVITGLVWLADGSGLIITAAEPESGPIRQIWHVAYPGGETRRVTNDTNNYLGLSLTADSSALVTVQAEQTSNIWTVSDVEAVRATQITSSRSEGIAGLAWTPDGRIVYTSSGERGFRNIFLMNGDGSGQKQLTDNAGTNIAPSVSPDGRYIVFSSSRSGTYNIWRMNIDGGNPTQLTHGSRDANPSCSMDGQWVLYTSTNSDKQTLAKVAIQGGNPVQLTDYTSAHPVGSPDGKQIACGYVNEQERPGRWRLAIIPASGGPPIKTFDMSGLDSIYHWYQWTPDGRALLYNETRNGVTDIWSQPVDGGPPKQLTDFKSDIIFRFDWSRDGKRLVLARGNVSSDVVLISDLK
jgi:serine/threonine protein kinase/Tol biopolymer transport system component